MSEELRTEDNGADGEEPRHTELNKLAAVEPSPIEVPEPDAKDAQEGPGPRQNAVTTRLAALGRRVDWLVLLNLSVAVGTGFQACYARDSNELTRDALAQSDRHHQEVLAKSEALTRESLAEAQRANQTAERAAAAAETQIDIAADTLRATLDATYENNFSTRAENRARIALLPYWVNFPDRTSPDRPSVRIDIGNFGKTAATDIRYRANAIIQAVGSSYPTLAALDSIAWVEFPSMAPDEDRQLRFAGNVADPAQTDPAKFRVVALLEVEYCDVFRRSHQLAACYIETGRGPGPSSCSSRRFSRLPDDQPDSRCQGR